MDGEAFGREVVDIVRGYVEREIAPIKSENEGLKVRLAELEARPIGSRMEDIKGVVEIMISDAFVVRSAKDAEIPSLASIMETVRPEAEQLVADAVAKAVAAIPAPRDGQSVTVEDVAPLIVEEVAKLAPDMGVINEMIVEQTSRAVAAIPVPKDGKDAAGIVEALKDNGELVLTLQDGRLIRTGIRDGEKGADGFSLESFDVEALDERTIALRFAGNGQSHSYELAFPVMVYRDVYKAGETYTRGDVVTWGGSLWHCNAETKDKPGTDAWTLAAKKGRDGKNG